MKHGRFRVTCLSILVSVALVNADTSVAPKPDNGQFFYIYAPKSRHEISHYAPSGWMGDRGDLWYGEVPNPTNPSDTCIKIKYSAKGSNGADWAGIYWLDPASNWGSKPGGYNLSRFKKLTFLAKGEQGGEKISDFKVGGIQGLFGDTDSSGTSPVELTKEWKQYTINLGDGDLSRIVGGFCLAASRDENPEGFTLYLNDIRFEP